MTDKEPIKKQKQEERERKKAIYIENKQIFKEEKKKLDEFVKKTKLDIKQLQKQYKLDLIELKLQEDVTTDMLESLKMDFFAKRLNLKNEIVQQKFDFGAKYEILKWKCLKWTHGLNKEFNRIIWSNTTNTFKYLGIIVLIIAILALLFFGIDSIVNTFK